MRLSQMQDIAGCRIVVTDVVEQDRVLAELARLFSRATLDDRRGRPSHGYRAVHYIVSDFDNPVEIQLRSSLQHHWAEISEKLSDIRDPSIKYGGGTPEQRESLDRLSSLVAALEQGQIVASRVNSQATKLRELIDVVNAQPPGRVPQPVLEVVAKQSGQLSDLEVTVGRTTSEMETIAKSIRTILDTLAS